MTRRAARRLVTLIESYGWQKTMAEWIKCELSKSVKSCCENPLAVLLVIKADTSFTEDKKSEVEEYMTIMGDSVWKRTIVLFTCGDWLGDTNIEQHIESEGVALQWLLEACGNRYHVFNNMIQDDETLILELMKKVEQMFFVGGRLSDVYIRDKQSIYNPPTIKIIQILLRFLSFHYVSLYLCFIVYCFF